MGFLSPLCNYRKRLLNRNKSPSPSINVPPKTPNSISISFKSPSNNAPKTPNSVSIPFKPRSIASSLVSAYPNLKSTLLRKPHAPQKHSKFRSLSNYKKRSFISLRMGNCLGGIGQLFQHSKRDAFRNIKYSEIGEDRVSVEKFNNNNVHEVIDIDDDEDVVMQNVSDDSSIEEVDVRDVINDYAAKNNVDDGFVGVPVWKKLHQKANERDGKISGLRFDIEEREKTWEGFPSRGKEKKDLDEEWFKPLTEEDESLVAEALSVRNRGVVVVSHYNSNIDITGEKLRCLIVGGWLNDEVINVYLALLKEREKREPGKFLKCHFFNTFFYKKLIGRGGYSYQSVQKWTTQKKLGYTLLECDKIFVPIHRGNHWCLAVINKREEKIQYLDSLKGFDPRVLHVLAKYYIDEVNDKNGKEIDISSWELENVFDLPEQMNGSDCGMFMIKYADFYSRNIGLCFSQENMPYFRKRTAKELLRSKAD